jgi:ribokinase
MEDHAPTSRPLVLSLGSINADFTFEVDADLGAGGTIAAKSFFRRAGGKAANVAAFAQGLGMQARLLGRVGDDVFAEQALAPLRDLGVDLAGVSAAKGETTGIAMISVPKGGSKTILLAANANEAWDDDALADLSEAIAGSPQGSVLTLDFEVSRAALDVALDAAVARKLPIVADASFPDRVEPRDLARLNAVTPNASEAGTVTGMKVAAEAEAGDAARRLVAAGVGVAYVKLSDGGCMMGSSEGLERMTAPKVQVIDKTGAGDAFTAAVSVALAQGRSAREAGLWGIAAATLAVTQKGSQESYPDQEQFEEMLRQVAEANRD